jgi:hypothetical protein
MHTYTYPLIHCELFHLRPGLCHAYTHKNVQIPFDTSETFHSPTHLRRASVCANPISAEPFQMREAQKLRGRCTQKHEHEHTVRHFTDVAMTGTDAQENKRTELKLIRKWTRNFNPRYLFSQKIQGHEGKNSVLLMHHCIYIPCEVCCSVGMIGLQRQGFAVCRLCETAVTMFRSHYLKYHEELW